jgi:hypothetical protein
MDEDKEKINANEIVSPKNTEKLYGSKAEQSDPLAQGETVEESLPENFSGVDQEVGHNLYPSHSARDPHELADDA